MKIELWMDLVCPYCFLGARHLRLALQELSLWTNVEVQIRAYELDPDRPLYVGKGLIETLMNKYGITSEEAVENMEEVGQRGTEAGIDFRFGKAKPTNTRDAHRLIKYAQSEGKAYELSERIFQSYFEEGGLISNHELLLTLVKGVHLDQQKAKAVLEDSSFYLEEIHRDESRGSDLNFDTVPYVLIDDHIIIDDSGTRELYMEKLKRTQQT